MTFSHYDRLTGMDTVFLDLETTGVHMHVGSVGLFDPGDMAHEDGSLDFERIQSLCEAGLAKAPRFRQKLSRMPVTGQPVWIDDEHFNLLYHVRHTALPLPGDERRLKRLVGRIMSEKLDRSKPMWELWFVEGLEGGRAAVVSKVHHCLIDGISGVDLLSAFMGPSADHRSETSEHAWVPRPAPSPVRMLFDEASRRASLPGRLIGGVWGALRDGPSESLERATHTASGFVESLKKSVTPGSETSLNVPIGPHRRFDWTRFDMEAVKHVGKARGGTVNDVVLATVSGAVRSYLGDKGENLDEIDFRAFVPVSTRTEAQRGKLGNRVTMLVADLPVSVSDRATRFELVVEETSELKVSGQAEGTNLFGEISDWTSSSVLSSMSRLAASRRAYNLVVTNVPGPPVPVYMDGGRLLETYPLVPLFENQALGIALFSYDGGLHWGFNACWDALPDLHDFALAVDEEFQALLAL
jgi:WS/DGAT/MGAT family acyltransferase